MLNRNKKDINSYVNGNDLEKYLSHLRFDNPFIFRHSELAEVTGGNIEALFRGNNSLAIILLNDLHPSGIGHYVCLRKDSTGLFSWFDCLGNPMPQDIRDLFLEESKVIFLTKPLMSKRENLCGKYCIAFANAGNLSIPHFAELLRSSTFSPDHLIANLYRLNYGDNVITEF